MACLLGPYNTRSLMMQTTIDDQNSNSKFLFNRFDDSMYRLKNEQPLLAFSNQFQFRSRTFKDMQPALYESNPYESIRFGQQSMVQAVNATPTDIKEDQEQGELEPDYKKGLRFLALRLSQILKKMELASYREVSSMMVQQIVPQNLRTMDRLRQEKNIKRRVYDALNVLIAVGVIEKKCKRISIKEHLSVGKCLISNNWESLKGLQRQIDQTNAKIEYKANCLESLMRKYVSMRKLHARNAKTDKAEQVLKFPVFGVMTSGKEIKIYTSQASKVVMLCSTNKIQLKGDLDLVKELFPCSPEDLAQLRRQLGWEL